MEALAAARGAKLESLSAAEWDELWRTAKKAGKPEDPTGSGAGP
jgi:hypothetical protein